MAKKNDTIYASTEKYTTLRVPDGDTVV